MKTSLRLRILLGCMIAAVALSLAGCYTLLKHPRFTTEDRYNGAANEAPVTYADDCSSCHESGAYLETHGYGPPPPAGYDRWYYYYEYPWWIPYYTSRSAGNEDAAEQQQRPFGRRHRGAEESQPEQPAVSVSNPAPSPSIISKTVDETKKEEAKPEDNDDRRSDRRSGNADSEKRRERKP